MYVGTANLLREYATPTLTPTNRQQTSKHRMFLSSDISETIKYRELGSHI